MAGSKHRVCLCLQKAVQRSHTLEQGEPYVHCSTPKAKLQCYPSSFYLLTWPGVLTQFHICTAGFLGCQVQKLAAHLGVSKLCCVASPRPLALLSTVLPLSEQTEMKNLQLHPNSSLLEKLCWNLQNKSALL